MRTILAFVFSLALAGSALAQSAAPQPLAGPNAHQRQAWLQRKANREAQARQAWINKRNAIEASQVAASSGAYLVPAGTVVQSYNYTGWQNGAQVTVTQPAFVAGPGGTFVSSQPPDWAMSTAVQTRQVVVRNTRTVRQVVVAEPEVIYTPVQAQQSSGFGDAFGGAAAGGFIGSVGGNLISKAFGW